METEKRGDRCIGEIQMTIASEEDKNNPIIRCIHCDGSGIVPRTMIRCPYCNGKGKGKFDYIFFGAK